MQSIRLEEYTHFENELPFVLHTRIPKISGEQEKIANWHENLELQFCLKNKGFVLLNGERYDFKEKEIAVANSGVLHYTSTDDYLEYACLILDTRFCLNFGVHYKNLSFAPIIKSEKLSTLFQDLLTVYTQETEHRTVILNAIVLQILAVLCQDYSIKTKKETPPHDYESVKRVVRYIREHYGEKISLDQLSKIALCDKYALTRIFKKATGQTVTTYINRLRCNMAANMLANGESVTQTALACGFENFSYFSKTFFAYMKILPSKYKTHPQTTGAGMR